MNRPVPPFLTGQPRWVLWREVTAENGRKTKPPFRVLGAGGASHANPEHWAPYALAERVGFTRFYGHCDAADAAAANSAAFCSGVR